MNEPGEPLYAQINRDLKTKRTRSNCGGIDGTNDMLLMTATTAMSSTTSTIRSEEQFADTTSSSNVSTLKLKNRAKIDIGRSELGGGVDIYKNLNNNNNNNNNNNANNNQNQWV